jgi:ribosomal protein S27AE
MRANEVVRYHCGDCQVVFDLCVDHVRETEVTEGAPVVEFGVPTCCPFCGAGELTPQHDTAIRVAASC